MLRIAPVFLLAICLSLGLLPGAAAGEAEVTVEVLDESPPEEVSEAIRAELQEKAIQLRDADGPFFTFWLRKELPVKEKAQTEVEALKAIEGITLLGALKVHTQDRYDFRDDPIDKGVFVLRLALQPQDGNHLGTAPYDYFATLLRAKDDREVEGFSNHDVMIEEALENTVAEHPPVLSLQPVNSVEGEFPRLQEGHRASESKLVVLKFNAKAGGDAFPLAVGLAYYGFGEI